MPHIPPQNVNDALLHGGIPELWTPDMLEWLKVRSIDLSDRGASTAHREWRMRWANTYHDLLMTIAATPKSQRRC